MKFKLTAIFICALVMSIFTIKALADNHPALLFCPSPSQIIIKDIYSGTAKSADGKWTGESAIPPQNKNNWRQFIDSINYDSGGYCQYFIGGTEAIDLQDTNFPSYNLYDITIGTDPMSNCWDTNPSQAPLQQPTSAHPCYFYKNPVM